MAHPHWKVFRAACYLVGRGVTFGAPPEIWQGPGTPRGAEAHPLLSPVAMNDKCYSVAYDSVKVPGCAGQDSDPWSLYERESLDHVYIGPNFAGLSVDHGKFLRDMRTKLKTGKHLIFCVKVGPQKMGQQEFYPHTLKDLLAEMGRWQMKGEWEEDGEYLAVLKKLAGTRGILPPKSPAPKRACIARYGALGDGIIMTPLIRALKEDGYEVTLNITTYCAAVFENNPYVDNILIQEKDIVPNQDLSAYWNCWEPEYDKFINLSESIEGDLLAVEMRREYYTTKPWRVQRGDKNYYDYTLVRGGYPHITGKRGELYFTNAEERRAQAFFEPLKDKFVVVWALKGSSHHKVYPLMEPTLHTWFAGHPNSVVITVGSGLEAMMEFPHPQMIPRTNQWSIRESMIATKYADLVVGPETMVLNSAGCFDTPKIVFLSHSTKNAFSKYFLNDHSLEPDVKCAPCYPCFQLHYSDECPKGAVDDIRTGEQLLTAPICTLAITPERVLAEMETVYQQWYDRTAKTKIPRTAPSVEGSDLVKIPTSC